MSKDPDIGKVLKEAGMHIFVILLPIIILIFVIAYIGNGQTIEEPQTGDVCKIAPLRSKVLKVIRVVPDSAWKTKSSGTSSSKISSKLVEFIKGYEKFYDHAYQNRGDVPTIGYGDTNSSHVAQGSCTESEATAWLNDEINEKATELKQDADAAVHVVEDKAKEAAQNVQGRIYII